MSASEVPTVWGQAEPSPTTAPVPWHREFDSILTCVFILGVLWWILWLASFIILSRFRRVRREEEVERWSLPFQVCCVCVTFSFAAALAVPVTTVSSTQAKNLTDVWVDAPRLVDMLWSVTVKGSNLCLFLLLPFAYFYTESSWRLHRARRGVARHQKVETQWGIFNAWWRQFVGRFTTSLIEVSLLGTILYGLFFILEVFLLDGGVVTWKYPSAVVSAAHILPGLLVFVLFTPVGLRKLLIVAARRRQRLTMRPSTVAQNVDSASFEVSSLTRKLGAAEASLAEQRRLHAESEATATATAHVDPTLAALGIMRPTESPGCELPRSAASVAQRGLPKSPERVIMSFDAFTAQTSSPPVDRTFASPDATKSSAVPLATPDKGGDGTSLGAMWSMWASSEDPSTSNTAEATPVSTGPDRVKAGAKHVGASNGPEPAPSNDVIDELRERLAAAQARKDEAERRQRRCHKWIAWLVWPLRAAVGWLVMGLALVLSAAVVIKAATRPFLAAAPRESLFLFDLRPWYHWAFGVSYRSAALVGFCVDMVLVSYFVAATIMGAYDTNSVHRLSLARVRPVPGDTPMQGIIANVAIVQLLSYSLPAAASILGLGAFDVMREVEAHYGDVQILRHGYFVLAYNLVFVAVAAWMVFIRAKEKLSRPASQRVRGRPVSGRAADGVGSTDPRPSLSLPTRLADVGGGLRSPSARPSVELSPQAWPTNTPRQRHRRRNSSGAVPTPGSTPGRDGMSPQSGFSGAIGFGASSTPRREKTTACQASGSPSPASTTRVSASVDPLLRQVTPMALRRRGSNRSRSASVDSPPAGYDAAPRSRPDLAARLSFRNGGATMTSAGSPAASVRSEASMRAALLSPPLLTTPVLS